MQINERYKDFYYNNIFIHYLKVIKHEEFKKFYSFLFNSQVIICNTMHHPPKISETPRIYRHKTQNVKK